MPLSDKTYWLFKTHIASWETDLIYCEVFFLTTLGSWDGLGWGRMPGILQESIAVLQSSSALIVLYQKPHRNNTTHSLRKHFLRLWGSRSVLCHLRYLEGIIVNKFYFLPCKLKAQSSKYSWTRWDRRGRWLCTGLVSLHYKINQDCFRFCSPKPILAADSLKILSKCWRRLSDYTTHCAGGLEKSVAISCQEKTMRLCYGRILWEMMAKSQV